MSTPERCSWCGPEGAIAVWEATRVADDGPIEHARRAACDRTDHLAALLHYEETVGPCTVTRLCRPDPRKPRR